jgi:hypothetical protein
MTCSQFHLAFAMIFFCLKLQIQIVSLEKLRKTLLYKKAACKMSMKLTPRLDFIRRPFLSSPENFPSQTYFSHQTFSL